MEISVVSEVSYSSLIFDFSNFSLNRPEGVLSLIDMLLDQLPQSSLPFHISVASPPPMRTLTKQRPLRIHRVKRKILFDHDSGEENGYFVIGDGWHYNGGDGFLGNGGRVKGWNFGDHVLSFH